MRNSIAARALFVSRVLAAATGFLSAPLSFTPSHHPRATRAQNPKHLCPQLTLGEAIEQALARNTNVEIALQDIRIADARLTEARAGSLPTLVGTGVYTRLDSDRKLNGNTIAAADQLSANLNLTVPIIAPQRWAQWSNASANTRAVRATSGDVRRQIAVTVARAYLTVVTQKRVIEADERALQTAKSHAEFAHKRLAGGSAIASTTCARAQEVATNEAALQTAQTALLRGREALGVLLGGEAPVDAVG